jgi:lipopolysaccharide biosynthesis glycosyltransferase
MPTSETHDNAVVFSCDRNYFHFALFVIRQIAFHNPHRRFDFVIASQDDLVMPDWAKHYGIILHRAGALPPEAEIARFLGSMAPLYRLAIARELGGRYRRILSLDCDMFVDGGDLNRLFDIDIGLHPLAAVLDAPFFYMPRYHAREYSEAGLPALPFFNAGFQLIDTRAYCDLKVEERCFAHCRRYPDGVRINDQSLINLVLKGGFAQLAPCWNWQLSGRLPLVPHRYPVFLRHFVSQVKPDRDSSGRFEARFNLAYREYMTRFAPDQLQSLAPPGDPMPMSLADALKAVFRHVSSRGIVSDILRRFPDPYVAQV